MAISQTKPIGNNLAPNTKGLGVKSRSGGGKFNTAMEDAQKEEQLNESKEKLLKSEELVSAKLQNPSDHPISNDKGDDNP